MHYTFSKVPGIIFGIIVIATVIAIAVQFIFNIRNLKKEEEKAKQVQIEI